MNTATTLGVPAFEDNKINITIYPNPSNGKFQFAIDDLQFAKNSKAIMYDIKGVVVYQTEITNVLTDVDLSHLTSGMYFVKIYNEHTTITKKIIIE